MASVPILLKWGKSSYVDQLTIQPGSSADALKLQIQSITGVPVGRQKLLCPKVWKGALKDGVDLPETITPPKGKSAITVTLIGSADTLVETPVEERPRFSEDMTPQEIWNATRRSGDEDDGGDNIVDIPALQMEPGMDRDDGKMEMYEYNRLVMGLPQHQINDVLLARRGEEEKVGEEDHDVGNFSEPQQLQSVSLKGEVAMTMGMELRRTYINSLAVLPDGTIVSGLDDGHIQLWRRGRLVKDARHTGAKVDIVQTFPSSTSEDPAFVTAGDGSICLWTAEGDHIMPFGSFPGTSPASIAVGTIIDEGGGDAVGSTKYLAACFRVTRQVDPNQFRLVPQNEAERQRREAAEVQERMIQDELMKVSRYVML